jgi:hypothetical protein
MRDLLTDILECAGLDRSSAIRVVGPASLAALIWFCRHGYDRVGYVRRGRCPAEEGDLVLVPQICDLATVESILRDGPRPRLGGVLIVQASARDAGVRDADPVRELLMCNGYGLERCLHGRHRLLYVARRRVSSAAQRAA